ncbi:Na+/H+ antiporter subunit G [Neptunomonas antarctica]|uniref:Multisubunit potassium/proton antiporter, PhaG subunit n=1 Tax=Neptunomonas antarctica TaxID=619304 RepID=A0A1N7IS82_9GAMM|nr:Na+/H+ antiporter subunit G [Neptunomonas antarctica]SIS39948.1 multisubunit potassium/proton antiporter, PhaG subunit [Neptunomonas antarctica]
MEFWIELVVSVFLVVGAVFVLIGSLGLAKLPDFYTRLHGPTKATTLGMGCLLAASVILVTYQQGYLSLHELLITLFLLITAPVTAHMLAKTAMHHNLEILDKTSNKALTKRARDRINP